MLSMLITSCSDVSPNLDTHQILEFKSSLVLYIFFSLFIIILIHLWVSTIDMNKGGWRISTSSEISRLAKRHD